MMFDLDMFAHIEKSMDNSQQTPNENISHLMPKMDVPYMQLDSEGLAQDCSISTANALEILQSCIELLIWLNSSPPSPAYTHH